MESPLPLVSVVIPCYNVEGYIDGCLESVFNQTYSNIEVICIDNNSTDNTWRKLEAWRSKIIFKKELKKGACAARNKGLSLAKGKYIQFLDADDLLLKGKIKDQISLCLNKTFSFVSGAYKKRSLLGFETKVKVVDESLFRSLFFGQLGITSSNLWSSESLEVANGWNESLSSSQETDLMFRLLKGGDGVIFDFNFNTIIQERSSGQISTMDISGNLKRYIEVRVGVLKYLKENNLDEDYCYQVVFDKLREFSSIDLDYSIGIFRGHFPKRFVPKNTISNSRVYRLCFLIFGFKYAERLKMIIK